MVIRLIPSAVLWGYFAFMALESLGGSQFWERLVYLVTDPAKRYRYFAPKTLLVLVSNAVHDSQTHLAGPNSYRSVSSNMYFSIKPACCCLSTPSVQ